MRPSLMRPMAATRGSLLDDGMQSDPAFSLRPPVLLFKERAAAVDRNAAR